MTTALQECLNLVMNSASQTLSVPFVSAVRSDIFSPGKVRALHILSAANLFQIHLAAADLLWLGFFRFPPVGSTIMSHVSPCFPVQVPRRAIPPRALTACSGKS